MNNRNNKYYKYRHKRKKKFYYYCHNNKPFFYHKKYKKNDNINILLQDNNVGNVLLEPVNNEFEENNIEQLEIVPQKKQEEVVVLPKLPIIKMALGIVIFVALVFGISYSYFNYYQESVRQADITMGEVYVRIPENKANITLTKVYPRTNTEARSRNDNYFDFTVNAKNTSSSKILYYTLNINDGEDVANKARISRDYIKVDLQEKINNEYTYLQEGVSLSNFTFEGVVPVNTTSEITREFRLRIWVSDSVLISDTEPNRTYTQSEFANLYANYHISVNSHDGKYTCVRATTLHTETCTQSSNNCYADGYTGDNTTITYGNLGTAGTLVAGDAFDCDVNGNGIVDVDGNGKSTERFYYVSPYYDTGTKTFDNTTATLIYYSNTYNGLVSTNGAAYYASASENWHGPVTAATHLPSTSQWSNITLKNTSRTILACGNANCSNTPVLTTSGGTISNPFSYTGKAARLLTLMELANGCKTVNNNTSLSSIGSLTACNFLFEGTKYADSSKATYGPWLETPHASYSNRVWDAYASYRFVGGDDVGPTSYGARPAIDVVLSDIQY